MPDFSNNKRIAKNTLLLYVRMLLITVVQLYTSRVVLNTLGVEDYGTFNVVGGIVTMFAFLNTAMVTSTQRYITFELGKQDYSRLQVVFNTSLQIHLIIAIAIILLGETVGLWFLYNKMVIPEGRMVAAQWVFHLSIITMIIQVMSVPYNSLIIAHERMGVFALISVIEAFLKLAIVFILMIGMIDKLILYAVLIAVVQLIIRFFYILYCKRSFPETRSIHSVDKPLIVEMGKFAGWNLVGNMASVLMGSGVNLLLNVFFGPVVNAARAIAVQVEAALTQFSSNFMMAVNPQITKQYAQDNLPEMHNLINRSSKFTFFLLLAVSLPIFIETGFILTAWLKIVPDYTIQFLRLLIIIQLLNSTTSPILTAASATGNVKKYQTIVGGVLLVIVPIAYIVLKLGGNPISVYIVYLVVCILAIIVRLLVVRPLIRLSLRDYFLKVVVPCAAVTSLSFILSWGIKLCVKQGTWSSILICLFSVLITLLTAYLIGLDKKERYFINKKIIGAYNKLKH